MNNYSFSDQKSQSLSGKGFTSTKRNNPCPICQDHKGKCRLKQDDGVLCMTYPGGDGHPDYRFVKATKDGLWGIHYPRKADDFDREKWLRDKAERDARKAEIERQRLETCLFPEQRDIEIRKILSQLPLSNHHRRYLENRGNIPAHIINNCRTVKKGEYGQALPQPIHVNLAGAWKDGNGLSVSHDGILIPIVNHLDQFVALRLHDPNHQKTGNAKYIWLTSNSRNITAHLPNGELPAATYSPDNITIPKTIGLCEGMEFKAAYAANRLGFPVMGFSGHNAMVNSFDQIKAVADHHNATQIIIIPDDNVLENNSVFVSITSVIDQLETAGYMVSIAWWGQTQKGIGDIDEISPKLPIKFISVSEFLAFCPSENDTPKTETKDSLAPLKDVLNELADKDLSKADEIDRLAQIKANYRQQYPPFDIEKLYRAIKESDEDGIDEQVARRVNEFYCISKNSLNLHDILPEVLAYALTRYANQLSLRPEVLLLILLTGINSQQRQGTEIQITDDFSCPPNLFGGIVALSGQLKTPAIKAVAHKPLIHFQRQAYESYQDKLAAYQLQVKEYKLIKDPDALAENFPDGEPNEPKMEIFYSTDMTFEALGDRLSSQEGGILALNDELAGLFYSLNQYKKAGNDGQRLLELYNGNDSVIIRKSAPDKNIKSPNLCIIGGIQPKVLEKLCQNGDGDGLWARFLFVNQPRTANELVIDDVLNIDDLMLGVYRFIQGIPKMTFTLDRTGRELVKRAYDSHSQKKLTESDAMANVESKVGGIIGRLTIALHCLAHWELGEPVAEMVSPETVRKAILATDFFVNESKLLYAQLMGGEDKLPHKLAKLVEYCDESPDGAITLRQLTKNEKNLVKTAKEAEALCLEAEKQGLGKLEKVPGTRSKIFRVVSF